MGMVLVLGKAHGRVHPSPIWSCWSIRDYVTYDSPSLDLVGHWRPLSAEVRSGPENTTSVSTIFFI